MICMKRMSKSYKATMITFFVVIFLEVVLLTFMHNLLLSLSN